MGVSKDRRKLSSLDAVVQNYSVTAQRGCHDACRIKRRIRRAARFLKM
jgi:hypothetical protein